MQSEIKRLTELSQCKHLMKTDRDAILWAISLISSESVEDKTNSTDLEVSESEVIMQLPLNAGYHAITMDDARKYISLYPAIDIANELRAMHGWLDANPKRRKTKSGIARFINSWLSRAQDKGGSNLQSEPVSPSERFRNTLRSQGKTPNF